MASKNLQVEIITPKALAFEGEAESVSAPGSKSPFQILINHVPIVSSLDIGIIKIGLENGTKKYFASGEGFLEFNNNKVSILVSECESAENIDVEIARAVLAKAEEALLNAKNEPEQEAAQRLISKAKNLIKARELV